MPFEEQHISGDSIIVPHDQNTIIVPGAVISQVENNKRKKSVLFAILVLLLLAFLGITVTVFQKKQPIADIRNYAHEDETVPRKGFGSIVSSPTAMPAKVANDNENNCPGGSCGDNSAQTIPAIVTNTPTPTIIRKATKKPTVSPSLSIQSVTATQSPTPIAVLSCQKIEVQRAAENLTQNVSDIKHGDAIQFIGYVSDIGKPVATMTFRLTINDKITEEKAVPAILTNGFWVGQYAYTFSTYGKHRVTIASITPK